MTRRTRWRAGASAAASLVALLALLALAATGCAEANPLPSPGTDVDMGNGGGESPDPTDGRGNPPAPGADDYAYIRGRLTYVSSLKAEQTEDTVVVVGAPGAASHPGPIRLTAPAIGYVQEIAQDATGAFAGSIEGAYAGLEFTLTLLPDPDDPAIDPVPAELDLTVRAITGDEPSFYFEAASGGASEDPAGPPPAWDDDNDGATPGAERSGFLSVTAPDEDGLVHLRSDELGITAFARVLVWNRSDGLTHVDVASNNGELDMVFPAQSGDTLSVFAASPNAPEATTEAVTLLVP